MVKNEIYAEVENYGCTYFSKATKEALRVDRNMCSCKMMNKSQAAYAFVEVIFQFLPMGINSLQNNSSYTLEGSQGKKMRSNQCLDC